MNKTQDHSNGISHSASQIQKAVQSKGAEALDEAEEVAESASAMQRSALETGLKNADKAMSSVTQKQIREPSRQQPQPDLSKSEPEAELKADSEPEAASYSVSESDSESTGSDNRFALPGVSMLRSYMSLMERNSARFYMAFDAYLNMLTSPISWPEGHRLNEGREGGRSNQGQGQGRRMDPMRNKAQSRQSM